MDGGEKRRKYAAEEIRRREDGLEQGVLAGVRKALDVLNALEDNPKTRPEARD